MELLVYGNRKSDDMIWDISTPEKKSAAFLALFKVLRDDWQVYESDLSTRELGWVVSAGEGSAEAAEKLLKQRRTYEYEEWHFANTEN